MATRRTIFKGDLLTGGVNDTPFPDSRSPNQMKTQDNVTSNPQYALERVKGRTKHSTATDVGAVVTDIMIPPKKTPLVTLTSANNSLYFRFGAGPTYATATLATGDYYSYSGLGAALQAALNTAELAGGGGASNWTVAYTAPAPAMGRFTITHASTDWAVCWYHSLTTLDASLFAFYWSVYHTAGNSVVSYYTLNFRRPHEHPVYGGDTRYYSISGGGLYNEAKTEQDYYVLSRSYEFSESPIAGAWSNNKYYFSDGEDNYICRFLWPQKQVYNGLLTIRSATSSGAVVNNHHLYYQKTDHATLGITLSNTARWARLPCREIINLGGNTRMAAVQVADSSSLWLRTDGNGDFDLNIYYEFSDGQGAGGFVKELLTTVRNKDLSTVAGGAAVSLSKIFRTVAYYGDATYGSSLLLEFSPRTLSTGTVEIWGSLAAGSLATYPSQVLNSTLSGSDSIWVDVDPGANYWAWYGNVSTTPVATTGGVWNIKVAAENYDGYVCELSDAYPYTTPVATEGVTLDFRGLTEQYIYDVIAKYDIKRIIFYRTEEDGENYYEWFSIDTSDYGMQALLTTNTINAVGIVDATLITQEAADVSTSRTTELPYNKCALWENRLFANLADSDLLYYSEVNQPENFNLSDGWIRIGTDGSPITGIAPAGDRLIVFKESAFHIVRPASSAYATDSLNDDGIGTLSHYSLVSDATRGGTVVFFQGNDSRFYVTDGVTLTPLSGGSADWPGRLEEYAKGSDAYSGATYQNTAKLSETVAFLNTNTREVVWSVCTGSATVPDKNVVFSQVTKSFHFEDMAAHIWKSDRLTSGTIRYLGAHDSGTEDLVWYRESSADLAGNIDAAWETADLDFGNPEEVKHFLTMELSGYRTASSYNIADVDLTGGSGNPVELQINGHPFVTGSKIYVSGVVGTTELNGNYYTLTYVDANNVTLNGTDVDDFSAYTSGGTVEEYITVEWFADAATSATGTANIVLTTAPAKYKINCPCRGNWLRVKVSDTSITGTWKFNQLLVEYEPIRSIKRA